MTQSTGAPATAANTAEPSDMDDVVATYRLPIDVGQLGELVRHAKLLYGPDLVVLTSHRLSRQFLVLARTEAVSNSVV